VGALDVSCLRALVASAEKDHDSIVGIVLTAEVHPEARPELDAKFMHAFTHGTCVAKVAQSNPRDALTNTVSGLSISKSPESLGKGLTTVRAGVDPNFLLFRHPENSEKFPVFSLLNRDKATETSSPETPPTSLRSGRHAG